MLQISQQAVVLTTLTVIGVATAVSAALFYRKNNCRRNRKVPEQWTSVGRIEKLHLYPLKSGRRIELTSAECTVFGTSQVSSARSIQLRDRSFILFRDDNNEFRTARTDPKMVLIEISVHDETHVAFEAPGMRTLYVEMPAHDAGKEILVTLHKNERVKSIDCGEEAASWFSRYILDQTSGVRLGFNHADEKRRRDITKTHAKFLEVFPELGNSSTGIYSDLTSTLLLNQSSVDDLNMRISGSKVTAENFRPNIIVKGSNIAAYAEDDWEWVKVGEAIYRVVKPCTRCILTTVDPESAVKNADGEPLTTLRKYRLLNDPKERELYPNTPIMGLNLETIKTGVIKVNDELFVAKS